MEKRILLVEDGPADVALAERAFKKARISSLLAVVRDGEEALDYLFGRGIDAGERARQLPQVILLDLKLPKIDGLQVLKEIRSNSVTKFIPVVILTSSDEELDLVRGYASGANSYLRKPVDFDQFVDMVKRLHHYWLVLNETPPFD